MSVPSSTAGSLESGDSDYFRIVLQQAGTLELRTTGSVDTCGVLYWEDGRSINESCDGPGDDNFRIRRNLPTGTYFVEVHGYDAAETGDYSLEVSSYDSGDNHSDFRENATEVAVPSSTAGNLEPSRDSDYFRIVLQQATDLELYTTGNTDTYGVLYRADGSSITEDDDGGTVNNFRISRNLAAGNYFVEVRGADIWETGAYSLEVAFTDSDDGGDGDDSDGDDGGDDHGDSRETATKVAVPSSTAGSLESSGDSDYFRIVLQQAATLELHTTGSTDTYGVLYREDGSSIIENDDGGNDENFQITSAVAAGTYFLEVRGYSSSTTGSYRLEAAFDDHGNSRETATEVAIPSSTDGRLEPAGDSDYFRFVLQQTDAVGFYSSGSTDTHGLLYNANGNLIDEDDDSGTVYNFRIDPITMSAGTYFLEVRGINPSTTGSYSLESAFGDDHGNSRETATEVAVPSSTAGRLGALGDTDYFRFVLQQAATLDLRTTGSVDTFGILYGVDGSLITVITEEDDGGVDENFRITSDLEAGTYFLAVDGYNRDDTGSYRLEVAFADSDGGGDGGDG